MANLSIICRTPDAVRFYSGPTELKEEAVHSTEASTLEFSTDSTLYAISDAAGVSVFSSSDHSQKLRIPCTGIQAISLSPAGTYLTILQRPYKNADGVAEKNLKVWNLSSTKEESLSLHQKSFNRDNWPSVQFTSDDSSALHMVTNTIHVYSTADWSAGPLVKFPVKGLAAFAVSPAPDQGNAPIVAVYVPEAKGSPGHVALYKVTPGMGQKETPLPIARRSFFRANSARFYWSPTGSAVLVLTAADVDATNQSYYGEQKLYFFCTASSGSSSTATDMAVPLPKEGPIHDVQWNPRGDCFVTVAGFMPAKTTVFTSACVPKYDLGSGPYSTARWNFSGRFLVLAGCGNLPGDLAFFDRKADGKLKPMGTSRAENGVSLEWSPCGRYILAATIAPRLRVDNGIQVFKYDGTLLLKKKIDVLFEGRWKPTPADEYEDRPQSPRVAGTAGISNGDGDGKSGVEEVKLPPQPVKASGYVPPHLRDNPAAAAAAKASFSLARDPNDIGGKITSGLKTARPVVGAAPAVNLPPGAAPPPTKSANKNARRRAKKKVEDGVAGLEI